MVHKETAQNTPADELTGSVLVVDDNADIITLTRRILERHKYSIYTASNGTEGLETARRERPDVILLDVMMPDIDGLEVCRQLKADPELRKTMVLLITGRGSVDHRVEGLEAGADDYITKPFHLMELVARVRSALRLKRLTEEIELQNQKLLDAQKERLRAEKMATIGLLATGIAHEFNNIMSGISGFAQLASKDDAFKDQLVEVTLTQCERAMRITNSLSTFYRPSVGKKSVSVQKTLEDALCLITKEVKEREVQVVREFSDDDPHVLALDGQLQEVFLNLIINALHAMDEKGTLTLATQPGDQHVRIAISDSGCGMTEETLDHIFDPFFTTKGALGGGSKAGSGLGLSVSYNIVNSHQGTIRVESAPGKGSTFTICLPARDRNTAAGSTSQGHARYESNASGRDEPSILVADPDVSVREMVDTYLKGWKITLCDSWEDVRRELEQNRFNVAVLDTGLDGGNFEEAFIDLVDNHQELRVILTSSHFSKEALKDCVSAAYSHLLKPYAVENLATVLECGARLPVCP
jgi:signal transduction histidine kinase